MRAPGRSRVTLALRTELQCGRLLGGTLVVRLPAQERMPATVAPAAVLVAGKPSGAVAVTGHASPSRSRALPA